MANTPIYGWETPDDTDYVYQGASAARTTANAIDATVGAQATTIAALPQGVKSYVLNTGASLDTATTTEIAYMASPSFTPVAGRLYAITITIGAIQKNTSNGRVSVIFRKDNTSGTLLQTSAMDLLGYSSAGVLIAPFYYSNTFVLTSSQMGTTAFTPHISIQGASGGFMAQNSSTRQGTIIVQDIGPA